MTNSSSKNPGSTLLELRPIHRVIIALLAAIIVYFFVNKGAFSNSLLVMLLWDVFALAYISITWLIVLKQPTTRLREHAKQEDGSRFFVLLVIVISSLASMLTVLLLIISKENSTSSLYLPLSIAGMLLSWVLVHTTFGLHYAHMFYGDDKTDSEKHARGLEFPKEDKPDLLDFAYFSFVIGMTFQVSDVQITSRIIRRTVLVHGLLSFVLNTFVVALTVNLIAGLKN